MVLKINRVYKSCKINKCHIHSHETLGQIHLTLDIYAHSYKNRGTNSCALTHETRGPFKKSSISEPDAAILAMR